MAPVAPGDGDDDARCERPETGVDVVDALVRSAVYLALAVVVVDTVIQVDLDPAARPVPEFEDYRSQHAAVGIVRLDADRDVESVG